MGAMSPVAPVKLVGKIEAIPATPPSLSGSQSWCLYIKTDDSKKAIALTSLLGPLSEGDAKLQADALNAWAGK